jgi:RNA polymerase sigma-54 factor
MKIVQEGRLEQKLSPQLIASLRLLQLPTAELEAVIKQEVESNPLLEEIPREEASVEELAAQAGTGESAEPFDEQQWREVLTENRDSPDRGYRPDPGRIFDEYPQTAEISLQEHLLAQLQLTDLKEVERRIGEQIIGSIDEYGYLVAPLEEIAETASAGLEDTERILEVIQTFDPSGVGARNLQESLALQLRELGQENTILMAMVEEHLEDLEAHRIGAIAQALDLDESDVEAAVAELAHLNPRPASGRFGPEARMIVPDLIVERVDDEYLVVFNDSSVPGLRINDLYRKMLASDSSAQEETRRYIVEKLNSARWLLRSIQQRRNTMLMVTRYIVNAQQAFLERGRLYLRPMNLQEVADAIGMHVSTISRVTNGKYLQTPQGVFELKYFFSGRIENKGGEDVSSKAIQERIERLVGEEDPNHPLSDQKIAKMLQQDGFEIARRTVAKYRDQLGIRPARFRKQSESAAGNSGRLGQGVSAP